MNDKNNTPAQHEAAIQEGERIAAADEYFAARTWIMDTKDNRRIFEAGFDRAYALLSKLRAPVAGAAFKDECAATGQTCSYGPHGPNGQRQCKYCGAVPDAAPQASEAVRDALWTLTEHNALHFGEQHNTVIQGRAALSAQPGAQKGGSDA